PPLTATVNVLLREENGAAAFRADRVIKRSPPQIRLLQTPGPGILEIDGFNYLPLDLRVLLNGRPAPAANLTIVGIGKLMVKLPALPKGVVTVEVMTVYGKSNAKTFNLS